jgi:hypothetical protein
MLSFIISITSTDTSAILANAGGVVGDFMPLIVIVVGIEIGFIIFEIVMNRKR